MESNYAFNKVTGLIITRLTVSQVKQKVHFLLRDAGSCESERRRPIGTSAKQLSLHKPNAQTTKCSCDTGQTLTRLTFD